MSNQYRDVRWVTSFRPILCLVGAIAIAVWAVGCGGEPCGEVSCEFGVCQAGACVNPSSCETDLGCLPGYVCGDNKICKALTTCSADAGSDGGGCAVGRCVDGTCVNPQTCQTNEDCLARSYCADDQTCRPDPCNRFECSVGRCQRGTTSCADAPTCTPETEARDCVDGKRCLDGACLGADGYCEALDCGRGECNFERRSCVNADDCAGDSGRCVDGFYCDDNDECVQDLCAVNAVECSDGQTCAPSVGQCQTVAPCSSNQTCSDDQVCVDGQCQLLALACGPDGCPGNQSCQYDAATMEASCGENGDAGCTTSLDCRNGRQCGGRDCLEPVACQADAFEANDDPADAVDLNAADAGLGVRGSICSSDHDYFAVDLDTIANAPLRGDMIITVAYDRRDIGLGELELEVVDPDGTVVGTDTSGQDGRDGQLRVQQFVSAVSPRNYTIAIGDAGDVAESGVHYRVSADLVDRDSLDACDQPTPMSSGVTRSSDTARAESSGFGSSCLGPHHPSRDDIYGFEVAEASRATIDITPEDAAKDFAVSVRRACDSLATEVACTAGVGDSGVETVLDPGHYVIIVQAADSSQPGGAYDISLDLESTRCSPADSACIGSDEADVCQPDGAEIRRQTCALGCSPQSGRCRVGEGDRCEAAIAVDDGANKTIVWDEFGQDYQVSTQGCLANYPGSDTSGPDVVYSAEVPPNYGLQAKLDFAPGEHGAVYIATSCLDPARSCVAGGNDDEGSQETATYFNDTGAQQSVFVVAESRASDELTAASLSVDIDERVCRPGTDRCDQRDDVETCNTIGTGYAPANTCDFGCTDGACVRPPNQSCAGAIALTSGEPVDHEVRFYTNDFEYNPTSESCAGGLQDGKDGVYTITTTQPNQRVSVSVDAPFDASITVARHCLGAQMQCLAGADTLVNPETLAFTAREAGSYAIIVDTEAADVSGRMTVTATVEPPACTPGEINGCNAAGTAVSYCAADGTPATQPCTNGCSGGACQTPAADSCADPVVLADGDTVTTSLGGTNERVFPGRIFGGCALDKSDRSIGYDDMYRVDLQAGELLDAGLETDGDEMHLFVVEDCFFAARTCVTNNTVGGATTQRYYAERDRSVYLVVDSTSGGSTEQYTLSVDVADDAACAPGESICTDQQASVQQCNADGSAAAAQYDCPGDCVGGACLSDVGAADTCATAPNVGNGTVVWGDFDDLTNSVEVGYSGCTGTSGDGNDLVYAVDLAADELVVAEMTTFGAEKPMLYIVSDCSQPTNSCLDGQTGGDGQPARARHVAEGAETVYVVADTTSISNNEGFWLSIDKAPVECSDASATSCVDAQTQSYCDRGLLAQKTCYYGNGCIGRSCAPPTHDTCSGAVEVPADGVEHTYRGYLADFGDDYDIGGASCTQSGYNDSPGPDAVYRVDAAAGDVIDATWTGSEDPSIWITRDCEDIANACVANAERAAARPVGLTYVAEESGSYYIVGDVDEDGSTSLGEFEMTITQRDPECLHDQEPAVCVDATTLKYCGQYNAFQQRTCAVSCNAGSCSSDTCAGAEDVTAAAAEPGGTTISGIWSDFANDIGGSGCGIASANKTVGQDVVVQVDLADGQTVDATLANPQDPSGSWFADPTVAIVASCGDITADTCLAGDTNDDAAATASYTATEDKTVFIIADHDGTTSAAADENFVMDVVLQ